MRFSLVFIRVVLILRMLVEYKKGSQEYIRPKIMQVAFFKCEYFDSGNLAKFIRRRFIILNLLSCILAFLFF